MHIFKRAPDREVIRAGIPRGLTRINYPSKSTARINKIIGGKPRVFEITRASSLKAPKRDGESICDRKETPSKIIIRRCLAEQEGQ